MIKKEEGFTLVEILISMLIFVLSLILVSNFFTGQLMLFKQHSKQAESNIEGIIGLETLRQDIEHAGYGLLWAYPSSGYTGANYSEATSGTTAAAYNDASTAPPRAILSGNNLSTGTLNNSDYLVVKSDNVGMTAAAGKWTSLLVSPYSTTAPGNPRIWTDAGGNATTDNLASTDRVIVMETGGSGTQRVLVTNGNTFYTTYGVNGAGVTASGTPPPWAPSDDTTIHLVYGIDSDSNLRFPFNRADYYIARGSSTPQRCASDAAGTGGTGVLYKATLNQAAASFTLYPLLDCVADFQVVFGVDTDNPPDGQINCYTDDLATVLTGGLSYDAANVRNRVREVRVYVLTHEGQKDRSYIFVPPVGTSSITVGEPSVSASPPGRLASCAATTPLGRDFNFSTSGIVDWQNYKWKVYTLIATPKNLLGDR